MCAHDGPDPSQNPHVVSCLPPCENSIEYVFSYSTVAFMSDVRYAGRTIAARSAALTVVVLTVEPETTSVHSVCVYYVLSPN
jgi:hypothetical protein